MKKDKINYEQLSNAHLFDDMTPADIEVAFKCIAPHYKTFKKGEYIFTEGDDVQSIALLLDGRVHILRDDYWGNQNLIAQITPFNVFGETFAYLIGVPISVNAIAQADCTVLFINVKKALNTCSNNCNFHNQLQRNILNDIAQKNLYLSQKIEAITQRTTRDKLLTYLYQQSKVNNSKKFLIPFNRQQLADYLAVERSAMSNEISKLVKEKVILTEKNLFEFL